MPGQVLIIGSIGRQKVCYRVLWPMATIASNYVLLSESSVLKYMFCFVGSEDPPTENGSPLTTKKPRNKKLADVDIDFTKALDNEMSDVFAPPKNPKSILLPVNRAPCNTTLPEDCHYQPEDLVKLFLLPNVTVILITYYKWTMSVAVMELIFSFW